MVGDAARHADVQLTILVTSPRVAPGLMSWPAWRSISAADRRLACSSDLPVARAVAAAGYPVSVAACSVEELTAAAATSDVVWLASDDEAGWLPARLAETLTPGGANTAPGVEVEVLHASYDVPGARLLDLVAVMDKLRTSCPWDREQTHRSLARYLLEETYETLEAIDSGDLGHLREELGDLLLQVCFHARIASEQSSDSGAPGGPAGFTVDDVAADIVAKLVHRHPHVFGGAAVADAAEVERNWESLKHAEKRRASVLDGVPPALPALALADKVLGRAARVGVTAAPAVVEPSATLGDRLLTLVVEARADGLDTEQELRDAVRRLADTVRAAEADSAT